MYKIKVSIPQNRLCITIIGTLSVEEAKKARQTIESSIAQLQPGFDVINDISKLIRADDIAGSVLKEIMILLIQKGVKRVVRVVGTSKTALLQFANNSLQIEQYKLSYVPTLEEAEILLNEPEK
jgi:anti-anti-sigma regulatory factor